MDIMVYIGISLSLGVGITRCVMLKMNSASKKFRYYNYSKYAIKHKQLSQSMNQRSKNTF